MTSKTDIQAAMTGRERAVATAGSRRRYPWADMDVGDWFVVPGDAATQMMLAACASQTSRNHPGRRFATTAADGYVYCVRMPGRRSTPSHAIMHGVDGPYCKPIPSGVTGRRADRMIIDDYEVHHA